ncbi:MAG: hypothetical protein KDB53_00175, partial [Planctomycetes bacterium]|nr:hypothetical protein [Planctomycetota bacterium]
STYYGFFWYQGGVSYSIHTSFVRGVDEAIALERLKTALAAIEVLEGEERSRMIRSFHRANPTQVVMRPDVAIRRGRVYDFELGLVWTMPNGYWRVDPRKRVTGRFVEPFAAFELKSGALILLGLRSAPGGVDHPELHRLGLLARSRVRHARRRSKSPSPWNAKHIPGFLMSKIVWGDEDQPSGTLYATALVGDRVVEASLVGQVPEMRSNSRQLDEFLHGLQILDEPPVDLIIEEGRLECLRWGLAVDRLPDGFGTWVAADDVDPLEVMRLSAAGTSGKVTASAFPASGAPGEVKEILDRLIEEFQGHDDSGSDAAQIDRGWTTINDRRVEGFRVRNGDRFVEALALNDLGILYVLRMEGSGADLDSIRRALRWLD